jgi:hypothetical protein
MSTQPPAFDASTILDVLTANYLPCERTENSDMEVSSAELMNSIEEHAGEPVPLSAINNYMTEKGFRTRATSSFGIVWMLRKRSSVEASASMALASTPC